MASKLPGCEIEGTKTVSAAADGSVWNSKAPDADVFGTCGTTCILVDIAKSADDQGSIGFKIDVKWQ